MEGESMSEWKEVRLGDVILHSCSGGTPKSNVSEYYDGEIPWLNTKEIDFNRIYQTERNITQKGLDNSSAKWIDEKCVIIAMYGATAGKIAINMIPLTTNQACCNLKVDDRLADFRYIYYFLKKDFKFLASLANGGAQQNLNSQIIKDYVIKLPSLSIQKEISDLLWTIDAKIETNNKLNEKLEEMAQAIFKSWFVDFEPFKDKPFHETELGMIPEGWEVSTFSSIIEKLISGDWGKETPTGNYVHKVACIRGCDFENIKNGLRGKTPERFILERNFASKQPKPNDIVVEMSGGTATVSTGRICYITKELLDQYGGDIVCTNFCKIVRPLKGWSQYLYYYWQYKYDKKVMFCYENGTSGIKNFAINDFIDIESLLIPPKDELIKFNSIIDNIRVKIQMNGVENTRLASLRDTLLPRLMSGELIV